MSASPCDATTPFDSGKGGIKYLHYLSQFCPLAMLKYAVIDNLPCKFPDRIA